MTTKKSNHLFECLNAINNKTSCDYNPKEVSPYILTLFMAEHKGLINIASEVNHHLFDIPPQLVMKYYVDTVPKGYRNMKFTKKTEVAKDKDKRIKELMDTYGISKREAVLSC